MRLGLVALVIPIAAAAAGAGERGLIPAQMSSWQIVCGPGATECERYAAAEFQALFKGMTGA